MPAKNVKFMAGIFFALPSQALFKLGAMKLNLLLILFSLSIVNARAQDSTTIQAGFRASGAFNLLSNGSLGQIRQQFQQSGVDVSNVSTHVVTSSLAFVINWRKFFTETRLLLVNSASADAAVVSPQNKHVNFSGFGFGNMYTLKIIDSRRFMVGPTLGFDVMWYRLSVLPDNPQNNTLSNVLANPTVYNTIRFRQGVSPNLTGAISADYKTGWFKKWYDDFRLGVRIGYQFQLNRNNQWSYDGSSVNGLASFRSDMLFAQYSITFIRRNRKR